jgi:hypothetical protein
MRNLALTMEKSEQLERIKQKLELLKSKDNRLTNFGAQKHKYIFNKMVSQDTIEAFEKKYSITLPDEYKSFLTQIGNGGAGPYYGLESLEDSLLEDLDYRETDRLTLPDQPFPLTEAWNIDFDNLKEDEYTTLKDKEYSDPKFKSGLLRLANYGCGVSMNLVVNGPEYGKIWVDDRCNDQGLYPDNYFGNEEKIGFLAWYEMWLDESLDQYK